jgi:hypothetical protein
MALSEERLERLLIYCRMDGLMPGEELLLESLYDDAVAYMAGAGVAEPKEAGRLAQFDLCVDALVLDAWDSRGSHIMGQGLVENPAFRRRLNQLKLTEPVLGSDTGTGG